jgi:hypothetical protein
MLAKLATDEGKELYALRGRSVEPVIGQLKEARGVRRLMLRGLQACASEWRLVAAAHILRKWWVSAGSQRLPDPMRAIAWCGA